MPYMTKESLQAAKQMDLLTYLQLCDTQNLVHLSGDTYCTREHDSLKISNGKWHWFSRHIGGRSALDYLIKVKGFSLPMAVEQINGYSTSVPVVPSRHSRSPKPSACQSPIPPPPLYADTSKAEEFTIRSSTSASTTTCSMRTSGIIRRCFLAEIPQEQFATPESAARPAITREKQPAVTSTIPSACPVSVTPSMSLNLPLMP